MATGREWRGEASARAGLAGNPSDALGGAALAVPVPSLRCTVTLRAADRLRVRGPDDEGAWPSIGALEAHASRFGHEGADRLVTAALVTLSRHARRQGLALVDENEAFEIEWTTGIPRSVGLAGSSALVIATIRAAAARWQLDLTPTVVASLALTAERDELGIGAGWMDRAVQARDAPVLVDARDESTIDGVMVPAMTVVQPNHAIEMMVAWDPSAAAPSGRLHGSLRERLDAGDPGLLRDVDELVVQAHAAAVALQAADMIALAVAVDRSCELRRSLGALDASTAALVEVARSVGAAATSAGSGGAVSVVVAADRLDAVDRHFVDAGIATTRVALG